MIGQYLPNNNEKRYSAILQKKKNLNRPQDSKNQKAGVIWPSAARHRSDGKKREKEMQKLK
jgi:hypothetical protein